MRLSLLAIPFAILWSCAHRPQPIETTPPLRMEVRRIESPAPPESAMPSLVRGADGRTYLSWIEKKTRRNHALRFSVYAEDGWTDPQTIAEGDRIFARLTYTGTHRGEIFGIAPSGRRIEYSGAAIFTIEGTRISEVWVLGDLYGLLKQLKE